MSNLVIRPATPTDVPVLHRLVRELAAYVGHEDEMQAGEGDLAGALFGNGAMAEAHLGEQGGEAVAFSLFFSHYSTFRGRPGIYLEDLFVRETHRRRGIGRAMLAHLAAL